MNMLKRPKDTAALCREAQEMLQILYKMQKSGDPFLILQAEKLLFCYERPVKAAIRDLKPAKNRFYWILSSEADKKRVYASCNYLFDVIALGLGPEIQHP